MAESAAVRSFEVAERSLFDAYGLETRSEFFDVREPAVRTRVIETGSGPPLLFVHGGGGIAAHWAPLCAHLSGHRMLLVDRPGHGLSGRFDYSGVDLGPHAAAWLEGVLDALGLDAVAVVASSMGGKFALHLAHAHPERVRALALVGCPALLLDTSAPLPMRMLATPGIGKRLWASRPPSVETLKDVHRMMGHESEGLDRLPDEFWEASLRSMLLPAHATAFLSLIRAAIGPLGPRRGQSLGEDFLRKIPQPTLFVWGDTDAFGQPEAGRRAAELMPDARLEVVAGAHQPWYESPEKVAAALSTFLTAQRS